MFHVKVDEASGIKVIPHRRTKTRKFLEVVNAPKSLTIVKVIHAV